jgi:cytochrome P450
MTPEEAFDSAMRYENRANPYPYFDELRKTPVVRVTNGVYVVTGYEELIALAHDPRVSSDRRCARAQLTGDRRVADDAVMEMVQAYDRDPSFIASDPPDHDRARRQCMRFFGPPHSPDVIPSQEPLCQQIVNDLLDKAAAKKRIDVVDEFAYPLPVNVICRIIGVPIEDEPQFHAWVADIGAGLFDLGPDIATEEGQARRAKGEAANVAFKKYIIELVEKAEKSPGPGHDFTAGPRRRTGWSNVAERDREQHDAAIHGRSRFDGKSDFALRADRAPQPRIDRVAPQQA